MPYSTTWLPAGFGDILNTLTLIVTGAFLFYTVRTWREMVRSNENAEKVAAGNDRTTEETLALTRESNDATVRAVATAELQRRDFTDVLRAWMVLNFAGSWDFRANQPAAIVILFTNTGYSPALRTLSHAQMRLSANDDLLEDACKGRHDQHDEISSIAIGSGHPLKFEVPSLALTEDERTAVGRGAKSVYLYGHIDYSDIFGTARSTTFALLYEADAGHWTAAAKHNNQT